MAKPEVNQNTYVDNLFIQKYERYLPSAFDESLSILEKMNKIIEHLNRTGAIINGAFNQWNEIMEWVLNEGLTEVVVNKLNEMVLDGSLETIINVEILGSRARIVVDSVPPINPDEQTFWFEDVGNNPSLSWEGSLIVDESQVVYKEV